MTPAPNSSSLNAPAFSSAINLNTEYLATRIDWEKCAGLVPAIVQDSQNLRVLMLGYMNKDALAATGQSGAVVFFSRTKQRLWKKGETSGHVLEVQSIVLDCDQDTLLIKAIPHGPTCHRGTKTCFCQIQVNENATPNMPSPALGEISVLADLVATIKNRKQTPTDNSYTAQLFAKGVSRIAQKVGEEGVETALAAATHAPNLGDEAADLLYHLLVLLESRDLAFQEVLQILEKRNQKS